jgi:predicted phosphate transport protein (TIGR00153 family)
MAIKLFGRTRRLIGDIDDFLTLLSESAMSFQEAVITYLDQGASERFDERLKQVGESESRADELRRNIQRAMYAEMLMPDTRGDILKLLESLDDIINKFEETLWYFSSEKPQIPEDLREKYKELLIPTTACVEALVLASRSFFRDVGTVSDHLHKVHFYEKEADQVIGRLKNDVFSRDLSLAEKIHLRFFAERIVWISDSAEDVADELMIYAIKRSA